MGQQRSHQRALVLLARLVAALFSAVVGYLAWFRPPNSLFWFVRLGVTEWGYWLAPLVFASLARSWRRVFGWAAWLLSVAALVAQLPILQALIVARRLPARLRAAFGPGAAHLPAERQPAAHGRRGAPKRLIYAVRDDQPLYLDMYHPGQNIGPAPLVVVVHGGAWQHGDSGQLPALNRYLARRGYAVAAITYRLAPRHHFPAALDDLRAALGYIVTHSVELGVDPARLVLLGRSAGAQLALLAAYSLHNPAIRGVVSFYGPTDMHWGYDHPANPAVIDTCSVLESYLGGPPASVPEVYTAASPIAHVGSHSPPTLMIHGGKDEMVFLENSQRLADRLARAKRPHLLVTLPWAAHGCDANFFGPSGRISTYAIERFLAGMFADTADSPSR